MIHTTNTRPLLPPAKATMTTIYSCPSICPPHSKHWNPFVNPTTQTPNPLPCPQGRRLPGLTALPMSPPSASAATFCLICPHRGPVSQASQAHFCPEASQGLCIYWLVKLNVLTMVPLPENICCASTNVKKYEERSLGTLKRREASKRHRLSMPSKPTLCGEPSSAMAFWSGPLSRRTCQGLPLPVCFLLLPVLPGASPSCCWQQVTPVSRFQTLAEQPPCSPQRYQHPSQGALPWGPAHGAPPPTLSALRTVTPIPYAPVLGEAAFWVPLLLFSILQPLWFLVISVKILVWFLLFHLDPDWCKQVFNKYLVNKLKARYCTKHGSYGSNRDIKAVFMKLCIYLWQVL